SMNANAIVGGTNFSTRYVNTDAQGNYTLGAANWQWTLFINCCGNDGLEDKGYFDPNPSHIVNIPPTNQVVNITVYPLGTPYLHNPQRFGSQFGFNLNGGARNNYTIQATTNLGSTNWFTVTVVSNLSGSSYFGADTQAANSQRFYRVLLGP